MLRPAPLLVLALLALAPGRPAAAEPPAPPAIELPREGLSLVAPAPWTAAQPVGMLLELRLGAEASVWVRRDSGPGDDVAARLRDLAGRHAGTVDAPPAPSAWSVTGGGEAFRVTFPEGAQQHGFALVRQPRGLRLELEWVHKAGAEEAARAVERLLGTLDVTPYEHALRHVDLTGGWSLDVPSGWTRRATAAGHVVFASAETPPTFVAVRRAPAGADAAALEGEGPALWQALLGRAAGTTQKVTQGLPEGATRWVLHQVAAAEAGGSPGLLSTEERAGFWVSVVSPVLGRDGEQEALAVPATLRVPAEPGRRAGISATPPPAPEPALVEGRLESASAPRLTFRVPAAWTAGTPSSSMRVAQWALPAASPGGEGGECVVFFFGAGGGGSVEANFERWKKQFTVEGEPVTGRMAITEGLSAELLELSGRYTAETRPGSGVRLDKPGWGLLAAVVQVEGGPLFIKCVGPQEVLAAQRPGFRAWLASLRRKA